MQRKFVVTFAPTDALGVLGVLGEVVDLGAAMVRIIPRRFTTDRLPRAGGDIHSGYLVKRTTLLGETEDPSIYDRLTACEERILPRLAKLSRFADFLRERRRADISAVTNIVSDIEKLNKTICRAKRRAYYASLPTERAMHAAIADMKKVLAGGPSATGAKRYDSAEGATCVFLDHSVFFVFGKFWLRKKREKRIVVTIIKVNQVRKVSGDGIEIIPENEWPSSTIHRQFENPVFLTKTANDQDFQELMDQAVQRCSDIEKLRLERRMKFEKAIGKNYNSYIERLSSHEKARALLSANNSRRERRIRKIGQVISACKANLATTLRVVLNDP
jgi:hypothetical protein